MTPTPEAERLFKVWWTEHCHTHAESMATGRAAKVAWLTAYTQGATQEREAIAQMTEHFVNGRGPIRQQLAEAIRQRGG